MQINVQLYKVDLNYPDKTTFAIAQIAQVKLQFNFANKIGKKKYRKFPQSNCTKMILSKFDFIIFCLESTQFEKNVSIFKFYSFGPVHLNQHL